jgi:sec-independent protein translocase protein TatA
MVCHNMKVMFALFNLGGGEIILILALVLILFGAKKLPELAKGLGTGIKEFKKATRDVTDELQSAMDEPPTPPKPLPPSNTQPNTQVEAQQTVPHSTPGAKD